MSRSMELPPLVSEKSVPQSTHSEKTLTPCTIHTPSPTPRIDAQLRKANHRAYLLTISEALADLADSENPHCTKCAIDTVAETLTLLARDFKAAKKSGEWSKEEKKAVKKEAKALGKSVKRDVERVWEEGREERKAEKRGWW